MVKDNIIQRKLLIIVPTLNSYLVLENLTKSLINQEFKNWRVLFIDGESNSNHKQWLNNICDSDKRFEVFNQPNDEKGIYNAMNIGFKFVKDYEWLIFWGSDDWLPNKSSLLTAMNKIEEKLKYYPSIDLFICKSQYINKGKNQLKRITSFLDKTKYLTNNYFNLLLFLGRTPPHQSTFMSPQCRKKINKYSEKYNLAADLNFFLDLSKNKKANAYVFNHTLILLSDEGVSNKKTTQRLKEVNQIYLSRYGVFGLFSLFSRYIYRIYSRFK